MKRAALILASLAVLGTVGTVMFEGKLFAAPPESEELSLPDISPSVITPDVPTYVTIVFPKVITEGTRDPSLDLIKSPKLQYFDPGKGRWKTLASLKDDGKWPDSVKKDAEFTTRVMFLESSGDVAAFRILPGGARLKIQTPAPIQLRLKAKRKGERTTLVSPVFSLPTNAASLISFAGDTAASVEVPATFDMIDTSDPSHVLLEKTGREGYRVEIVVGPNPTGLDLETWVFQKAFGFTEPGTPSSFAEYPGDTVEPIQIAGLSGLKVTSVSLQTSVSIFLDDPPNQRVFWFEIFGTNAGQDLTIDQNLDEALFVVRSLQQ